MSNGRTQEQRAAMSALMKRLWAEGRFTRTETHNTRIQSALLEFWSASRRERVLAKVDTSGGPDTCWPWTGNKNSKGYGTVKVEGRTAGAHRVVYKLLVGELPDALLLRHDCRPSPDNPACCNPKHLVPGTLRQNVDDAVERFQLRHGEGHANSHLTEDSVVAIRARHAAGEKQEKLAADFGVKQAHISRIVRRQSWRHVA